MTCVPYCDTSSGLTCGPIQHQIYSHVYKLQVSRKGLSWTFLMATLLCSKYHVLYKPGLNNCGAIISQSHGYLVIWGPLETKPLTNLLVKSAHLPTRIANLKCLHHFPTSGWKSHANYMLWTAKAMSTLNTWESLLWDMEMTYQTDASPKLSRCSLQTLQRHLLNTLRVFLSCTW